MYIKVRVILLLRKVSYTSSASRNITKFTSAWLNTPFWKGLTFSKHSRSGRNQLGRIVVKTKGPVKLKRRNPFINYKPRFSLLSVIGSFNLVPFQNKLVSLCFLVTGGVTYLQSTSKFRVFDLLKPNLHTVAPYNNLFRVSYATLLTIPILSKISLVELYPGLGIQYVRSPGVFAKFIKINWVDHTSLLELPSGVHKAFSLYSLAFLNPVALRNKTLLRNTKAGSWKNAGWKSKVRGVAMNPVDHPHGGRTKAIKNPRTPWGKPTKLK